MTLCMTLWMTCRIALRIALRMEEKPCLNYTDLTISKPSEKLSFPCALSFENVQTVLRTLCGRKGVSQVMYDKYEEEEELVFYRLSLKAYNSAIKVTVQGGICYLEWESSKENDIHAEAVKDSLLTPATAATLKELSRAVIKKSCTEPAAVATLPIPETLKAYLME